MSTNVYLPKEDTRPEAYGFRWCTKDCRWESRANLSESEVVSLSAHFDTRVELVDGDKKFQAVSIDESE